MKIIIDAQVLSFYQEPAHGLPLQTRYMWELHHCTSQEDNSHCYQDL